MNAVTPSRKSVRAPEFTLVVAFEIERRFERQLHARFHGLARADVAARRPGCKLARRRQSGRHQFVVLDRTPDQAPLLGLRGRELVAQQRQTHRPRRTNQPRQPPGAAAVGHQAELGERLDEAGRLRGENEVARERDVGACARRHAVDGADGRHPQPPQAQQHRLVVIVDRRAEVERVAAGCHGAVGEVLACAEAPARTGQHQAAHRRIRIGGIERSAHFAVHRHGEAVQPLRAVECQRCHAVRHIQADGLVRSHLEVSSAGAATMRP